MPIALVQVFATRLLVRSVVHHRPLYPAVLRRPTASTIIHFQLPLAGGAG